MTDAIFVPDGDRLIPQPRAAGPWFPGVQHGGAVTGLMARAVEAVPSALPMMTTRLSVDMTRKVPMGPTQVTAAAVRDGKRVQSVECRYAVDGEVVARATATRIRVDHHVIPSTVELAPDGGDPAIAPPDEIAAMELSWDRIDFVQSFTMRRLEHDPGNATSWIRLDRPFVAGEETLPVVRLAMIADMIPSAGSMLDFEAYLSINPDLSITVARLPEGPWIGSKATIRVHPGGFGQTDAQLYDERGPIGRSVKSLLVDRR